MKRENNKGFSLIELIIVITLMAVAAGVFGYTLHLITTARSKSTAEKMRTAIENTRQQALARGGGYVEFTRDIDGNLYVEQSITNGVGGGAAAIVKDKIGSDAITVTFKADKDSQPETLTSSKSLKLEFQPGTGSFAGTVPKYIIITGGGRSYTLTCYKLTGKVIME